MMNLKIFMIKKLFSSNSFDSAFKKIANCYLQVFLKGCKYIETKVIRHINNNLIDILVF